MSTSWHAQRRTDHALVKALESVTTAPSDDDCIVLARLMMRYVGDTDVLQHLSQILAVWQMDSVDLFLRTRRCWASGHRPSVTVEVEVGSGFDTEDTEAK